MTIRVTDTIAEKKYEEAVEEYREKVDAKFSTPSNPPGWPVYPKRPPAMMDSNTEYAGKDLNNAPFGDSIMGGPYASPEMSPCKTDFDGTFCGEDPKGYDTNWQEGKATGLPFVLKPK